MKEVVFQGAKEHTSHEKETILDNLFLRGRRSMGVGYDWTLKSDAARIVLVDVEQWKN
jgi:hypothetical protein